MRRIENVNPPAPPQTGVLQQRDANMLVVPAHQLRGHLQCASFSLSLSHRLLDSPARSALADFHRHPELWRRYKHRLAQIHLLLHLDQELAHDITTKKLIIRGPADGQAMLRVD